MAIDFFLDADSAKENPEEYVEEYAEEIGIRSSDLTIFLYVLDIFNNGKVRGIDEDLSISLLMSVGELDREQAEDVVNLWIVDREDLFNVYKDRITKRAANDLIDEFWEEENEDEEDEDDEDDLD